MSADFLLELLSEEIPARMQRNARFWLATEFREQLEDRGIRIPDKNIIVYSTPRRLALIAKGLPAATEAVSEEVKGPKTAAPPQALDGFLRKTGLRQDQLQDRDGVWFAVIDKPGRSTTEVLAETVAVIVRDFAWPKSMRWGAASTSSASMRWVRPLHSIVALLGEAIVPVAIEGVTCGATTLGHRFHHPGPITIGGAHDYVAKLRACHVLVDHAEREDIVRKGALAAAEDAGFALVEDEGLVVENAGLTEWPVPLLGSFDPDYLDVPPEVIQLTARTNQKYFVMRDGAGALAPNFVCVANIDANDGGAAIIAGNERVLAARLSDARFFWQQDLKVPLEEQAKKLEQIIFHEKLGTVADKVDRVAKLARWLVEEGIVSSSPLVGEAGGGRDASASQKNLSAADAAGPPPRSSPTRGEEVASLANQVERAARLAKADLVTGMVGEFPELQGVIGGYLARAQGENDAVANAVRDHYKPVGQGDDVPTAPVTVAVSLADKLDTLVGFFAISEKPTGSKDPFALRRAMLGVIELIACNGLRREIRDITREGYRTLAGDLTERNIVIGEDQLDETKWSSVLGPEAAYGPISVDLLVLKTDPPLAASDKDDQGKPVWNPAELRKRGLVRFKVQGFVETVNDITEFCFDRLRDREKRSGRRHDVVSAVLARVEANFGTELGMELKVRMPNTSTNGDIIRVLNLSSALQSFVEKPEGTNLLAGYKRAANILKKETWDAALASDADVIPDEAALAAALDSAGPTATAAIVSEDFTAAMSALASLRAPIDAFFEGVMINDPDPGVRARRLNLLARFRNAVHAVADFSKIEG